MEIIKTAVSDSVVKLEIGDSFDDQTKTLSGQVELDIEHQSYFIDIVSSVLQENMIILVDMTHVSYIDSSGLWSLFEGHKKAVSKNSKMVLINTTKDVKRVLDITKMSSKLHIFETEEAALAEITIK